MFETLAALFFAHVLADYVFQTPLMVDTKKQPLTLLLHGSLVLVMTMAATGQWNRWEILVLAAVHLLVDAVKAYLPNSDGLPAYLGDQLAHLATIAAFAAYAPDLWENGFWATGPLGDATGWLPRTMTVAAGAIYVTRAGGFAVGKLMAPFTGSVLTEGLQDGGRLIGLLERGLIYLLLLAGQPAAIGFLIAAKSVMRFETASKEQKAAEYVIIGTLASFGWAIAVTLAVLALLGSLPPLEITAGQP